MKRKKRVRETFEVYTIRCYDPSHDPSAIRAKLPTICFRRKFQPGDKVRVTVELLKRGGK